MRARSAVPEEQLGGYLLRGGDKHQGNSAIIPFAPRQGQRPRMFRMRPLAHQYSRIREMASARIPLGLIATITELRLDEVRKIIGEQS